MDIKRSQQFHPIVIYLVESSKFVILFTVGFLLKNSIQLLELVNPCLNWKIFQNLVQ